MRAACGLAKGAEPLLADERREGGARSTQRSPVPDARGRLHHRRPVQSRETDENKSELESGSKQQQFDLRLLCRRSASGIGGDVWDSRDADRWDEHLHNARPDRTARGGEGGQAWPAFIRGPPRKEM